MVYLTSEKNYVVIPLVVALIQHKCKHYLQGKRGIWLIFLTLKIYVHRIIINQLVIKLHIVRHKSSSLAYEKAIKHRALVSLSNKLSK